MNKKKVINPLTGRKIMVGGRTYNKVFNKKGDGRITDLLKKPITYIKKKIKKIKNRKKIKNQKKIKKQNMFPKSINEIIARRASNSRQLIIKHYEIYKKCREIIFIALVDNLDKEEEKLILQFIPEELFEILIDFSGLVSPKGVLNNRYVCDKFEVDELLEDEYIISKEREELKCTYKSKKIFIRFFKKFNKIIKNNNELMNCLTYYYHYRTDDNHYQSYIYDSLNEVIESSIFEEYDFNMLECILKHGGDFVYYFHDNSGKCKKSKIYSK